MRVKGAVPSAWSLEARQFFLRRGTREWSEVGGRGRDAPVEGLKDLFDDGRIFNARDYFRRTAAVFTSLDPNLEHPFYGPRQIVVEGCLSLPVLFAR